MIVCSASAWGCHLFSRQGDVTLICPTVCGPPGPDGEITTAQYAVLKLRNVCWVPESPYNLVSISRLEDGGIDCDIAGRVLRTVARLAKGETGYRLYGAYSAQAMQDEELTMLGIH